MPAGGRIVTDMKWLWSIAGFAALLLMVYTCALPGDFAVGRDGDDTLAGVYTVNGIDPTGTEYSGTATVVSGDEADRYLIEWIVTGTIQRGTGIRTGDEIVVDWEAVATAGEEGSGRSVYTVEADGRLVGTRTVDGFDEPGTEELFPEP